MIAISKRQQVAQIRGAPIYVITEVVFIPLANQDEATKAILQTKESLKKASSATDGFASNSELSEDEEHNVTEHEDDEHDEAFPSSTERPSADGPTVQERPAGPIRSTSNVAEDVIGKKGQYGRFAERWFSRKGWTSERRKTLGMSADENPKTPDTTEQINSKSMTQSDLSSTPQTLEVGTQTSHDFEQQKAVVPSSITNTLLPKLLRTTRILLTSNSFFYSYDMDITRRMDTLSAKTSDLPLYKNVDPLASLAYNYVNLAG